MSNTTNNTILAMIVANSGNASTAVNPNVTSVNGSGMDIVEGSGAGLSEQEMAFISNINSVPFFGRRCRDRILIPCDFEEFITVRYI